MGTIELYVTRTIKNDVSVMPPDMTMAKGNCQGEGTMVAI